MIKNIIFDMGQVLIRWSPDAMLESMQLEPKERTQIKTELFQSAEWIQQDRGTLCESQVVDAVCARLPEKQHESVKLLVYHWFDLFLTPMPGMEALVRELRGEGYRLILLSNASTAVRTYFDRIPGSDCFEALMISAEEKLLKPSHEIYERLYEKFGLTPSECWFIDDSPSNVEGAIYTGMGATVFRGDVIRLRKELREKGIRCSEL